MAASNFIEDFEDIFTAAMNRLKIVVSNTTEKNKIKTYINEGQQELSGKKDWWWLYQYQRALQFPQKYNTGTTAPTLANATVEGNSTSWTGTNNVGTQNLLAEDLIKFSGDEEIYEVKTVTDGDTIILGTLSANTVYLESTKTAASYEAYRYLLDLPTNFSTMLNVYQSADFPVLPMPEGIRTFREIQFKGGFGFPFPATRNSPGRIAYYFIGGTESQKQLGIWPPLDTDDRTIYFDYKRRVTNLSSDGDEPLVPDEYRMYMVHFAVERYARYNLKNSTLAELAKADRAEVYSNMVADARQRKDADHPIFRVDLSMYRGRRRRFGRLFDSDYARR